jgi:hypothetical protein
MSLLLLLWPVNLLLDTGKGYSVKSRFIEHRAAITTGEANSSVSPVL